VRSHGGGYRRTSQLLLLLKVNAPEHLELFGNMSAEEQLLVLSGALGCNQSLRVLSIININDEPRTNLCFFIQILSGILLKC
jgi:hypothetical protein